MAAKRVLIVSGDDNGRPGSCAEAAAELLRRSGRYRPTVVGSLEAVTKRLTNCDALILHSAPSGPMPEEAEAALMRFVKSGKALVGIHAAAGTLAPGGGPSDLFGCRPGRKLTCGELLVRVVDAEHQATRRLGDFPADDVLLELADLAGSAKVLAVADWLGAPLPVMFARTVGRGRVFCTALGGGTRAFANACFGRSLLHGLDWACRIKEAAGPIRCGLLGYGGAFGMGKIHGEQINATPGLATVAACDTDPARTRQAKIDFPKCKTYPSLEAMLKDKSVDLVVNILPHNLHAETTLKCLRAGKHVVSEKPFCLTVKEADAMIRAARRSRRMLTVYHNRRWDGD